MDNNNDNKDIEFLDLLDENQDKSRKIPVEKREEFSDELDFENLNLDEDLDLEDDFQLDEDAKKKLDIISGPGKYKKKRNKVVTYVSRAALTFFITLFILLAGIYSVMCMLVYGPSPTAKDLFVMSVKETSGVGFLANWFFSESEIKAIKDRNSIKDTNEVTNTSLVEVSATNSSAVNNAEIPPIEVKDVIGGTYRGKLMIVKDPSRVFVGTVPTFTKGDGLVVSDIAKQYNAVAGINGGEFVDGDNTYTAMPIGLVISKGNIVNGDKSSNYHVTGFTSDNILVVGNMNGQKALDMKMRDAVSISSTIGPFLIINGVAQEVDGTGGGTNPRTAIGQRADGAVLLLVIDGRQVNSVGASFNDLIEIMTQYGAVNASAMDGGTSTQMYYNGEVINNPYSPTGPRRCPTSFLVGGTN